MDLFSVEFNLKFINKVPVSHTKKFLIQYIQLSSVYNSDFLVVFSPSRIK
ncbi:hypothetical protein ASZ90_008344 [hydrocarbon metagenome]|uniref:Uncharacterized protein n=1 Tax=hydrocarbon metagenome TaxID=938273 RepID=A0A0W8FM41_9ZZZZ